MTDHGYVTCEQFQTVLDELQALKDTHEADRVILHGVRSHADSTQRQVQSMLRNFEDLQDQRRQDIDNFLQTGATNESELAGLKAHVSNLDQLVAAHENPAEPVDTLQLGPHHPVSQYKRIKVLIEDLAMLINRTEDRYIKEAHILCTCTHTTINNAINDNQRRVNKRMNKVGPSHPLQVYQNPVRRR